MSGLTARQVIVRISVIIALSELLIMTALLNVPVYFTDLSIAVIDVVLLVCISAPAIYYLVIRPFKNQRDQAIKKLEGMAYTDPLTGLPNRRVLLNCMDKALAECVRHQIHAALMLIDLDDFKAVNDQYGHAAGDAVLLEIGQRLVSSMRKEDVVSRVGGDEFIVLIKQLDDDTDKAIKQAKSFAEKIQAQLAAPIIYKNNTIQISSSFGIHMLDSDTNKIEAAIRNADIAMYYAKNQGKGVISLYEPSMVSI